MASKETIDLPGGLQIEGMLYFPPSADVTIRTTHVIVLGTLKIDTPDIDRLVSSAFMAKTMSSLKIQLDISRWNCVLAFATLDQR
jgi:hypothetical protein